MDDEDVGLGDDVGGEGGRALGGEGDGEAKVAALAGPAGEGQGWERAGEGEVVGLVEDEPLRIAGSGRGRRGGRLGGRR